MYIIDGIKFRAHREVAANPLAHGWVLNLYLNGEDVRTVMKSLFRKEEKLPLEQALAIVIGVASGLHYAHEKKGFDGKPLEIIHRDVTPQNVIITYEGGVKLLDFGIAKATSGDATLTNTGFIAGTPAYMAPELIQGHAADRRTDIYSFGAMLYYAASGRLPFGDAEPASLFAAHVTRSPEPLASIADHPLPESFVRVVERCMAKNPDDRYPSTHALLDAL